MTFDNFIKKHDLKNKATSNFNLYEVMKKIGLDSKIGIYVRDWSFSSGIEIVNLHPSKGSLWVFCINENYFDSYGFVPPRKLSKFNTKRYGHCLCSEYKIQGLTNKRGSYCATYCLYILYFTKGLGIDFKSAVLNSLYQRIS